MPRNLIALIAVSIGTTACMVAPRQIGRVPQMSEPDTAIATASVASAYDLNRFPDKPQPYSTWKSSGADLFTARRAMAVGDILTVEIGIDDKASFNNKSDRSRTGKKSLGLSGQYAVNGVGGDAGADGQFGSSTNFSGAGGTARSEKINVSVAAIIVQILPSKNLVVRGSQEVLVNAELRVLTVSGIVRPSDVNPDNTIAYDRIAEARISYGGRGRISEVQQPAYGQQVLDMLSPL
jgi:flagellar L-ring protein precursor FlgH